MNKQDESRLSFHEYIEAQRKNLDSALRFELFAETCPRMNELYKHSIAAVPKDKSPVFGMFLLICHKSFLAAATLVGQAQPDDAGPITRRGIEAVRLAAAIKADPAIAEAWISYEERMERWKAREKGEKPKPLHVQLPAQHPLVEQLMDSWGIISDTDVHFTPEYFHSLRWEKRDDSMLLQYFTGEQRTIESAIVHLIGTHMIMLRVLDECMDGAFSSNSAWRKLCDEIYTAGKPYADRLDGTAGFDKPVEHDPRRTASVPADYKNVKGANSV